MTGWAAEIHETLAPPTWRGHSCLELVPAASALLPTLFGRLELPCPRRGIRSCRVSRSVEGQAPVPATLFAAQGQHRVYPRRAPRRYRAGQQGDGGEHERNTRQCPGIACRYAE